VDRWAKPARERVSQQRNRHHQAQDPDREVMDELGGQVSENELED
jgi:hypothetical protein